MAYDLAPSGAPARTRRRSSLLEALELFRAEDPNTRLSTVLAFLYLCENEGFCVSEGTLEDGSFDSHDRCGLARSLRPAKRWVYDQRCER